MSVLSWVGLVVLALGLLDLYIEQHSEGKLGIALGIALFFFGLMP